MGVKLIPKSVSIYYIAILIKFECLCKFVFSCSLTTWRAWEKAKGVGRWKLTEGPHHYGNEIV